MINRINTLVLIGLMLTVAVTALSLQDSAAVQRVVQPIASNISFIQGNIGLFTGNNGVFLSDDQ
jgi:hypothetical protein